MVRSRRSQKSQTHTHNIKYPSIFISVPLWISLIFIIYFINPNTFGVIPFFFFLFFFATYFTFKKLSIAIAITFFLILKYFHAGNFINLFLIVALTVAYEWYSQKSN